MTDWLNLQLQAEVPVSERDNGEALHFGISSPLFTSPNNAVTLSLTGSWGSSKYMQTYYGVNASQSAASGFARYDAGAGIYAVNESRLDAQAHPTLERGCWRRRYAADGDAADSPIVQRKPRRRKFEGYVQFLIYLDGTQNPPRVR